MEKLYIKTRLDSIKYLSKIATDAVLEKYLLRESGFKAIENTGKGFLNVRKNGVLIRPSIPPGNSRITRRNSLPADSFIYFTNKSRYISESVRIFSKYFTFQMQS